MLNKYQVINKLQLHRYLELFCNLQDNPRDRTRLVPANEWVTGSEVNTDAASPLLVDFYVTYHLSHECHVLNLIARSTRPFHYWGIIVFPFQLTSKNHMPNNICSKLMDGGYVPLLLRPWPGPVLFV